MAAPKVLSGIALICILVGPAFGQAIDFKQYPELCPESFRAFQRAEEARRAGQLDAALAAYDEAIRHCPCGAYIYLNRGQTRFRDGQVDGAIADYTEAIALKPESVEVFYARRADAWMKNGDLERAVADATAAIQVNPRSCLGYLARARVNDRQGKLELADLDYAEAARVDPQLRLKCSLELYRSAQEGDLNEAIGHATVLVRLEPSDSQAYQMRGHLLLANGEFDRALDDLANGIQLGAGGRASDLYLLCGFIHGEKRDFDRMMADVSKAMKLGAGLKEESRRRVLQWMWDSMSAGQTIHAATPERELVAHLCVRGALRFEVTKYDSAWDDFTEVLRLDPGCARAHAGRANVAHWKGDDRTALGEFTAALQLNPSDAFVYYQRAAAYKREGDVAKAMADVNNAIALDPKFADAYYGRGDLNYRAHNLDGALADMSAAIACDPRHICAFVGRGRIYHDRQLYDLALADFTRQIELNPTALVFSLRAKTYQALGEEAKASADSARAAKLTRQEAENAP